jgi:large subunit ribosomal protein L24
MKNKFSKHWKASIRPGKQRKYRANAPHHIKRKMISANLSKELRKKYLRRSFPVIKGDIVKIMTGEFNEKTGKISLVDMKKLRVGIEGIYKTKKDGTKINLYLDPSNIQIKELNLDNKTRLQSLEKKEMKHKVKENLGGKNVSKKK